MKRKIMFHGERVNWRGQIWQLFKDKKGKEFFWTGRKYVYFGSVYQMEKPDGHTNWQLPKNPQTVEDDWQPTDIERTEYEAQKIVVSAQRQSNKKAMTLKKPHNDIARAVNLIRPFYLGISNLDRRRFMDWFANECSKKGKR